MLEILPLKMASIWKVAVKQREGRRKVKNGFSIMVTTHTGRWNGGYCIHTKTDFPSDARKLISSVSWLNLGPHTQNMSSTPELNKFSNQESWQLAVTLPYCSRAFVLMYCRHWSASRFQKLS